MSLDRFEDAFLSKTKKQTPQLSINVVALAEILQSNTINMGKIIEIRAKELSGLALALQLAHENPRHTLLIDADKSFDKNWYSDFPNLLLTSETHFDNLLTFIEHTDDIKVLVFNTVLSLLPIDSNYDKFEIFLNKVIKHCQSNDKTIIFLNPYLDNKYDVVSKYSDLIIVNRKHTSIKKNEERLGYNLTGEIVKNTLNFKLGKFDFEFLYKGGIK